MLTLNSLASAILAAEPVAWGEAVRDSVPKLCVIAVSGARQGFQDSKAPDGSPWAPLAHPRPGGSSGKPLQDQGLLKASLSAFKTETGIKLQASRAGANTHQFGAVIRPRKAKKLAIPLTREAKRVGSPGGGRFPRPLFVVGIRDGSGKAFLAESAGKGKRAKIVYHYVLVNEVKVPKREFVGFSGETLAKMTNVVTDTYNKKLLDNIEAARTAYYNANPLIK